MRKQRDATYFGYQHKGNRFVRVFSIALLLGWLVFLQDGHAQSQQQNYNAVAGVTAGAGVMMGVGAAACAAVTAGGCIPIAAAGGILMGVGGTMGAMNQATGASSNGHTGPYASDLPDSGGHDFEDSGSGMGAGGGGGSAFEGPSKCGAFSDWFKSLFHDNCK